MDIELSFVTGTAKTNQVYTQILSFLTLSYQYSKAQFLNLIYAWRTHVHVYIINVEFFKYNKVLRTSLVCLLVPATHKSTLEHALHEHTLHKYMIWYSNPLL